MNTNSWDQIKAILRSLGSTLNKRIAEVASVAQTALNKANSVSDTAQKKMDAHNPVGTGSFSMGRREDSYIGDFSFAEGDLTTASGEAAHAEGDGTISSGRASHAEGRSTEAQGPQAHAEGLNTIAKGGRSHAEGGSTQANGEYSHAEGNSTQANGECSHAEGNSTQANGECSHSEGRGTTASGDRQHVQGRFNIEDTENRYAHIVGNGRDFSNPSNAHTLGWEGTAWYPAVKIGGTSEDDARDVGAAIDALNEEIAGVKDAIDYAPRADDVTLVNGIGANGNFGDDSVWVSTRCTLVIADNECVFTGTAADAYILPGGWDTKFALTAGHIIYTFATVKTESDVFEIRMDSNYKWQFVGTGEYAVYSYCHNITEDTSAAFIISNVSASSYMKEMRVRKAGYIDLTECFGAGNEPTKEQMNAIIAVYDNWVLEGTYNASDYVMVDNLAKAYGNFGDNTSWYVVRGTRNIAGNECVFTPTDATALIRPNESYENGGRVKLVSGHVMYYYAFVKTESDRMRFSFNSKYPIQFKGTGEYNLISGWVNLADDEMQPLEIANISPNWTGMSVSVKKVGAIDLTECYGAGNEPSKIHMDALLMERDWQMYYLESIKDNYTSVVANEMQSNYTAAGIAVLYLNGDTKGISKDNAVTLNYAYGDKRGTCTVKWQGSSSIAWPKKNYTIKFDKAFEAKTGWGEQKKYCFKANYIDPSHLRNIGSCRLWGEIVKSRANVPTELAALPNGGAIDGFPCVIVLNGEFHGLYTWNIPKDGWMFGEPKAIVAADAYVNATAFKALATFNGDFELEYVEDEDNADWVLTSFNRAIQAVIDSDGSDLDTTVGQYIDIPSVIDYIHHVADESAGDCVQNNALYVTYDGVKWYMSAYDRDTTYGNNAWGEISDSLLTGGCDYAYIASIHRLMKLVMEHKTADFKARGVELREGVKSEANVAMVFMRLAWEFPATVFADDAKRWPTIPSTNVASIWQVLNWYRLRRAYLDPLLDAMN